MSVEPRERHDHGAVAFALLSALESHGRIAAVAEHLSDHAGASWSGWLGRQIHQQAERSVDHRRELVGEDDRIDDAAIGEVFCSLHVRRERFALQQLVDLGTEEADQRTRLGNRDVRQ